jgi:hypothetical protein
VAFGIFSEAIKLVKNLRLALQWAPRATGTACMALSSSSTTSGLPPPQPQPPAHGRQLQRPPFRRFPLPFFEGDVGGESGSKHTETHLLVETMVVQ